MGLSHGAENLANRLGADIMIVPAGYDPHIDSILLSGTPSTFYLPADALSRLNAVKDEVGIEKISPQTFLATINASCCSYPVQLIGVDYETDFIVRPWINAALNKNLKTELNDGEIIIGYHVTGEAGEMLRFWSKDLLIAGRLEQTGMKFDSAVFMNKNTIKMLSIEAERILGRKLTNDGSMTSVIMLKLKPGYNSVTSAAKINMLLNSHGIYALFSKKFVNNISETLNLISWGVNGALILIWVLAVAIIALIFTLNMSERVREMGILRVLGASRKKLVNLVLTEAFINSLYGAVLGAILALMAVIALSPYIIDRLKMPFLAPDFYILTILFLSSVLISVLTGVAASIFSAFKAGRADIYDAVRN